MRRTAIWLAVTALCFVGGCDNHSTSSSSTTSPTASSVPSVAVSTVSPSTAPATQPMTTLTIDGQPVEFPAAKLVLTKKAAGLNAILCSDDPPNAIESTYTGNSFMIEMRLDIDDPADLPTAVWEFKTEKKEPQDSTTGIFLNGARRQMQPADVKVTFEKQGDRIVASIGGKFLLFDSHDVAAPVQIVKVNGKLNAAVREQ